MGRTNYGTKMMRKKGLVGRCLIDNKIHFGWKSYHLPMDNLDKLSFIKDVKKIGKGENIFYKYKFNINEKPCDTFLKLDNFKKGFVTLTGLILGVTGKLDSKRLYTFLPLF